MGHLQYFPAGDCVVDSLSVTEDPSIDVIGNWTGSPDSREEMLAGDLQRVTVSAIGQPIASMRDNVNAPAELSGRQYGTGLPR